MNTGRRIHKSASICIPILYRQWPTGTLGTDPLRLFTLQNPALRPVDLGPGNQSGKQRDMEGEERLEDGFDAEEQAGGEAIVLSEVHRRAVDAVGCQDGSGGFGVRRAWCVEGGHLRERQRLSGGAADLIAELRVGPGVTVA